jgi:PleD family two-component response regulator
LGIPHEKNDWGVTTISVGGAWLQAANGELKHAFRRADENLYRAKELGRNRAEIG